MALVTIVLEAVSSSVKAKVYSIFALSLKGHMSELACPPLLTKFNTIRNTGYFLGMENR